MIDKTLKIINELKSRDRSFQNITIKYDENGQIKEVKEKSSIIINENERVLVTEIANNKNDEAIKRKYLIEFLIVGISNLRKQKIEMLGYKENVFFEIQDYVTSCEDLVLSEDGEERENLKIFYKEVNDENINISDEINSLKKTTLYEGNETIKEIKIETLTCDGHMKSSGNLKGSFYSKYLKEVYVEIKWSPMSVEIIFYFNNKTQMKKIKCTDFFPANEENFLKHINRELNKIIGLKIESGEL